MQIKGGDKLEAALKRISANVKKAATVDVGFLEGSTEADGTSIPMIAAIQEFGAPKAAIPPRPFFRNAIEKNSGRWPTNLATALKATEYDGARALDLIGQEIQEEVQELIRDLTSPALSPITVMLRGMRSNDQSLVVTGKTVGEAAERVAAGKTNYGASTKPLVDSGALLNSVTHKVT